MNSMFHLLMPITYNNSYINIDKLNIFSACVYVFVMGVYEWWASRIAEKEEQIARLERQKQIEIAEQKTAAYTINIQAISHLHTHRILIYMISMLFLFYSHNLIYI
eukprot:GHVR01171181.1.p1 GENE.GHVR01171181.1~~GHVR01171181.1.p1  ORF type:complete len:106 (-),score=17.85 GHVR01171181.1:225-542(-)